MKLLWKMVISFLCCNGVTAVINQGYRNCLLGTGQQSPLLLQDGLRCVQLQLETKTSWDLAMDLCNSRDGHLVHIYSSDEAKLFNSWLIERPTTYPAQIGQKKVGLLNGNFTGYNIKWFTSRTEHIGIEQSLQYSAQYNLWEVNPGMQSESNKYGCTWAEAIHSASIRGYGSFCGPSPMFEVICQFLSDQPLLGEFRAQRGQRSLAPIYKTAEHDYDTVCAIGCNRESWCMGFNVIQNPPGVSCQFIAVKQNDTVNGMVHENGVSYCERVRG